MAAGRRRAISRCPRPCPREPKLSSTSLATARALALLPLMVLVYASRSGVHSIVMTTTPLPVLAVLLLTYLSLSGCVAQQGDIKNTERKIKESSAEQNKRVSEQTKRVAQQNQELEILKGEELPKLRGELEKAQHQAQEIQRAQDDLSQRSAVLEQQTRKLEQLSSKLESESANRYAQLRESLNAQDIKNKSDRDQLRSDVNTRLDDINRQMESLRKDIIDAVAKTNAAFVKGVSSRLDSIDEVIGTIVHRVEELEKRRSPVKK
jgi:chromosome segregation ATPase